MGVGQKFFQLQKITMCE